MQGRKVVLLNLIWRFAERCGAQGVNFVVSIILARLLLPEDYGLIALVTIIISVLQVFVDSGLGNSLIQKKNADDLDFSTVFYFNVFLCSFIYLGLFFAAPYIADFYEKEILTNVIRVLGLTVIISGLKNVQQAYVSKNLLFKRFFFATLGGTLGAAVIGVFLAYMGAGVWALVVQQVFNAASDTVILWLTVKWKPKKIFSIKRLKGLYSFGWKMLVSGLINSIYDNMSQLIIGKVYLSTDLAFYNRGRQFPNFAVNNINNAIDSVLLPVLSSEQDNLEKIKKMTQRAVRISSYILWPIMIGLAVIAEPLVSLILTDKWLPCVPYLRIFCITSGLMPIHTANLSAINALGRSDYFLILEIIKKVVGIIVLVITVPFGVNVIAYGMLVYSIACCFINAYPNRKLLKYSYIEQIKDIILPIVLSLVMGGIILPLCVLEVHKIIILVLQIVLGILFYFIVSFILKLDSYIYLRDAIKEMK